MFLMSSSLVQNVINKCTKFTRFQRPCISSKTLLEIYIFTSNIVMNEKLRKNSAHWGEKTFPIQSMCIHNLGQPPVKTVVTAVKFSNRRSIQEFMKCK